MSGILKSLFSFSNVQQRETEIMTKISKIELMVKEIEKERQTELWLKIKAILNAGFFEQKGESLYEMVYKSACQLLPVEWIPGMSKAISLFQVDSTFMKIILQNQDYKIPIEKHFIPSYLFKNNLLNESSGYQGLSNSMSGLMVPIIDYVFIRLLHALDQSDFIALSKDPDPEYQSDDMYTHISRNPYLMLLRNYLTHFGFTSRQLIKLVGNLKMFFVDQLILKHRINKSSNYLKEISIFNSQKKIKPHHILAVYLLLYEGRGMFQEKNMFFYEMITRFGSLIESETQIFFRFVFRVFLFAYSKSSAQTRLIEQLELSNPKHGHFDVNRYSIQDYQLGIKRSDNNDKKHFNDSKALLLKLLEKDYNLTKNGRVHFSLIRTLGCFLALEINLNHSLQNHSRTMDSSDSLRRGSQAASLQTAIQKICLQAMKDKQKKLQKKLSGTNQKQLDQQIQLIKQQFQKAYNRQIDMSKFQSQKQTKSAAQFGIRGNSEDFTFSIQTYCKEIEINPWEVPLKDSEYFVLYKLFYWIAIMLHMMNPWAKKGAKPTINLRYFCNPFVFMMTVVLLFLVLKVVF